MTNSYIFGKLNSSKIFDNVENFESLFTLYNFFIAKNSKRIKNHASLRSQGFSSILKKHFFDLKIFPNIEWLEKLSILIEQVSYNDYLTHLKTTLMVTNTFMIEYCHFYPGKYNENPKSPFSINSISSHKSRFLRGLIHSCIVAQDEELVQILKKIAINSNFIGGEPLTAIFIKDVIFSLSVLSETKVIDEIFAERNDFQLIKICLPFFDFNKINEIKEGLKAKRISNYQNL